MIEHSYTASNIIHRIYITYLRRHIGGIALSCMCMILVAAATAGNAWLMQPMLDKVFVQKSQRMIMLIPVAVIALAFIKGSATYFQSVIMRNIGQRMVCDMQLDLYKHLLDSDLSLFHDQSSGKLISRFTNDIQLMRNSITALFVGLARDAFTLFFLLAVMIYQSIELSIISFLVFPFGIYPVFRLAKRMRKLSGKTQAELGNFTAWLDETFQGIRIIKAYGREDFEKSRAERIINSLYSIYSKSSRVQAASSPLMEILSGVAIGGVVWYGGMQVLNGATTPGSFFSFVTAMIMAYKPAKTISNFTTNLQEGLSAAERMFSVMDTVPVIKESPDAKVLNLEQAEVSFSNVSFAYQTGNPVINNLSFHVPHGSKVAFVGSSGGGKSTLFNLLLRFYDADSGDISVSGYNIKDVTFKSLRKQLSIVTQETILFDDTIAANIAYGLENASMEEITQAAKSAGAYSFIKALPNGFETMIGQHGVRISGGQRQRIAIARAFLKDAPILLLDEATSALDPTTERQIQEVLDTLMKGKTCLIIAHRMATIMNADIINVIHNGTIVESGSHSTLLHKHGAYSQLYASGIK